MKCAVLWIWTKATIDYSSLTIVTIGDGVYFLHLMCNSGMFDVNRYLEIIVFSIKRIIVDHQLWIKFSFHQTCLKIVLKQKKIMENLRIQSILSMPNEE